ncbi:MAG: hypothetical protein JW862_17470 [Anaerolineales bacterium]|nr:hypothetical protein [Anaerolineales bacterium]
MSAQVECHSGSSYVDYPTVLYWLGQRLRIEQIETEWHSPAGKHYRVRTADQQIFELRYDPAGDRWQIQPS